MNARMPLIVAALWCGACSSNVDDVALPDTPVAVLSVADSEHGVLQLTRGDDEDPDTVGVQTHVRIDVNDDTIRTVDVAWQGEVQSLMVITDFSGRRAAYLSGLSFNEDGVTDAPLEASALVDDETAVIQASIRFSPW